MLHNHVQNSIGILNAKDEYYDTLVRAHSYPITSVGVDRDQIVASSNGRILVWTLLPTGSVHLVGAAMIAVSFILFCLLAFRTTGFAVILFIYPPLCALWLPNLSLCVDIHMGSSDSYL